MSTVQQYSKKEFYRHSADYDELNYKVSLLIYSCLLYDSPAGTVSADTQICQTDECTDILPICQYSKKDFYGNCADYDELNCKVSLPIHGSLIDSSTTRKSSTDTVLTMMN